MCRFDLNNSKTESSDYWDSSVCDKWTAVMTASGSLSSLSETIRSDCESGAQLSKAAFAMLFLGLLCSCVLLASFITASGYATFPSPLSKQMPTVAIGGMSIVFLLPGVICAAEYPDKFFDWWLTLAAVGLASYDKKMEWAMIMLILALISVFAATVMAYVGIDADDTACHHRCCCCYSEDGGGGCC